MLAFPRLHVTSLKTALLRRFIYGMNSNVMILHEKAKTRVRDTSRK